MYAKKPLPVIEQETEELEKLIEEQIPINRKFKKKKRFFLAVTLFLVVGAVASFLFYNYSVYNRKLDNYRNEADQRIAEYEEFFDGVKTQ